ncbi:MAG: YraN family protein [Zetaproteobacteria bacterium CG12_big_fil_rev_8_21_14_0_65_55_1124]|nr:MAG: YraN family protein [Zetaproteobacteria bacterium CG1_02_55_237]PIS19147.1 MAG: YraN family protein [Zetaproteobacteria bacterium CG08_land_8_20_14_0_20_55_17]PIW43843.1 MAG: YraN family protein [Zetaproteobacteria bacterium CG12_big_fil_rev_8_21_14_0_65_55_1124]PIY52988.1 MAG: YraN family protein [Zetaproteobacteria bacterium CG_4_10_14_0_8_um_filter_55_43]PIZ37622.1 MAG: YraN family protein [Zetaproteobacteria bacterium CG_4_10_14_0_2_um_filter_55_20]PJB79673.1 MAG: YraN family prote
MSTEKGRKAEDKAALHLRLKGYRILDRNARLGRGELDIVAVKDGILAFVEVKLRPNRDAGLMAVHHDKQERLHSAASAWLAHHLDHQHLQCRFDLIILTPGKIFPQIEHLQDVFR